MFGTAEYTDDTPPPPGTLHGWLVRAERAPATLLSVDAEDLQPSCTLRLTGSGSALRSIKGEIIQRLRARMPSLAGVLWED